MAIYAGYTIRIYDASKESADAAKEAADTSVATTRPWLRITKIETRPGIGPIKALMFHWPLTGKTVPPMLQVHVSVKNAGHTLAQDINVITILNYARFDSQKWSDMGTKYEAMICDANRTQGPQGGEGALIFPSDSWDDYAGVGGLVTDADEFTQTSPFGSTRYTSAMLTVCVNYTGPAGHYQTRARANVYEHNSIFIPVDVDSNDVTLIRDQSGDHAD